MPPTRGGLPLRSGYLNLKLYGLLAPALEAAQRNSATPIPDRGFLVVAEEGLEPPTRGL